jgi:hypothetical protein
MLISYFRIFYLLTFLRHFTKWNSRVFAGHIIERKNLQSILENGMCFFFSKNKLENLLWRFMILFFYFYFYFILFMLGNTSE